MAFILTICIGINQMDALFSQDEYDMHYMARRKAATIIACDVITPSKNVFASSMGTATVKEGYDILLTDIGEAYLADAATVKGPVASGKCRRCGGCQ